MISKKIDFIVLVSLCFAHNYLICDHSTETHEIVHHSTDDNAVSELHDTVDIHDELADISDTESTDPVKQEPILDLEALHLKQLFDQLEKYRLNAPWIIEECMFLKIEQFDLIWNEVIDILTQSERRWFYFCDNQKDFSDEAYWHHVVWQCEVYDAWLQKLCVNVNSQELVQFNPKTTDPQNLAPIFDFWDWHAKNTGQEKKYQQFYAFYFDGLSHQFNEYVNFAKEEINTNENFAHYFTLAHNCLSAMERCLTRLREAKQFPQYLLGFRSLQQILSLLEKEKASGES